MAKKNKEREREKIRTNDMKMRRHEPLGCTRLFYFLLQSKETT
jgi:hypothetical protein